MRGKGERGVGFKWREEWVFLVMAAGKVYRFHHSIHARISRNTYSRPARQHFFFFYQFESRHIYHLKNPHS